MHSLFATPLLHVNLAESGEVDDNLQAFVRPLNELAIEQWKSFARAGQQSQVSMRTVNNLFFQWQTSLRSSPLADHMKGAQHATAWDELSALPQFARLRTLVRKYMASMLQCHGRQWEEDEMDMFGWASVHVGSSWHDSHVHEKNVLSAVFYSRVPADAGRIVFEDPRSIGRATLHPWPTQAAFHPREGDLIIFPSWLRHRVEPGNNLHEHRVSFAFNLHGSWGATV